MIALCDLMHHPLGIYIISCVIAILMDVTIWIIHPVIVCLAIVNLQHGLRQLRDRTVNHKVYIRIEIKLPNH